MKHEEKRFVCTWRKEQIEEKGTTDFVVEALNATALAIGRMVIENPNQKFRWVKQELSENEKAETITLFTVIEIEDVE